MAKYWLSLDKLSNNEISNVKTFANSLYRDSVLKLRKFMFSDIEKTLLLGYNSQSGAPNFLLALGLCCYTEYWGKLVEGIKKNDRNNNKNAFNAFLRRLDSNYYGILIDNDVDFYRDIRCGLAHSYLIEVKGNAGVTTDYGGLHGIEYDQVSKNYTFWIRTYFDEFKSAINRYINGLNAGTENLNKLEDSLNGRPELI